MKRHYIDKLGITFKETPQGWNVADPRQKMWEKERKEYGFDERETWSLHYTIDLVLYERLMRYKEIASIDLDFHKFEYKGKTLTQRQCIDRMLEGLRLDLTLPEYDKRRTEDKKIIEAINDVYPIYGLCKNALWW